MTYVTQVSSFLNPRGYAVLHRIPHAFSDTPQDPHSSRHHPRFVSIIWNSKNRYHDLAYSIVQPEPRFDGGYPEWKAIDRLGQSWIGRVAWGVAYLGFYVAFATHWWMFFLVPIHWFMGPVHGAIVNWCGHRY